MRETSTFIFDVYSVEYQHKQNTYFFTQEQVLSTIWKFRKLKDKNKMNSMHKLNYCHVMRRWLAVLLNT